MCFSRASPISSGLRATHLFQQGRGSHAKLLVLTDSSLILQSEHAAMSMYSVVPSA